MGDIALKFDSNKQIQFVAGFVESIFDVYNNRSLDTIKSLNNKLNSVDSETMLRVDLSSDEISLLGYICTILSNIGADEIIAGCDISSKIAKLIDTESDVPRFLTMLKENNVPAEYCVDLFKDWCSNEGTAVLAENCMKIQSAYNIDMTATWKWLYNNKCSMNTDWQVAVAVARFKEVLND